MTTPNEDYASLAAAAPERAIRILSDPKGFFDSAPREGGYEEPGVFAAVMLVASAVVYALMALVGLNPGGFVASLILVPIFGAIGLLLGAAILYFLSNALGGSPTFESSFRIVAYASATYPISAVLTPIPYASLLPSAYGIYMVILGAIALNGVPEGKAWKVLGALGALLLLFSLMATMAGRGTERAMEEWGPEAERWREQMEKTTRELEQAGEEWRREVERQQMERRE